MTIDPADLGEHLDDLYRFALRMTRDPELAADVVQDTIVRALERGGQYRGEAPVGHWLMRIAHHLAIDRGRRSGREVLVEDAEADWRDDAFTLDGAAVVERAAARAELEDALARLPFIYRAALVLHDVQGLSMAEVASLQAVALPAAKQRLRRGRMALVRELGRGHERRLATKGVPLRCWDARQHVSELLNGELDATTQATVEAHLARCPTCPPLYAALVGVHAELGRLRDRDTVIPPETRSRIEQRLAASG